MSAFGTAIIDPPWPYEQVSSANSSGYSSEHYEPLDIPALGRLPIGDLTDYLFLWTTVAFLRDAYDLAETWGFVVPTVVPWIKVVEVVPGIEPAFKPAYGVGYWFRGCTEFVLVGKRPKMPSIRTPWIGLLSERAKHSRKPDTLYEVVETDYPGPYVELFARRTRPGWTSVGDEIDGRDIREALPSLVKS